MQLFRFKTFEATFSTELYVDYAYEFSLDRPNHSGQAHSDIPQEFASDPNPGGSVMYLAGKYSNKASVMAF